MQIYFEENFEGNCAMIPLLNTSAMPRIYFDAPLDETRKKRSFEHEPEKNLQPRRSAP